MKKLTINSFICSLIVVIAGVSAFAQSAKRIDLAKDGPSIVWEERVAANTNKSFVFYAKKGQKLSISMADDTKMASMDLGKISIEPNEDPYEEVISVSKDYTLYVSNNSSKSTSFRIAISLETPEETSEIPSPERINFPKGSIEVNLERTVSGGGAVWFVARAVKGQTVAMTITPKRKGAKLEAVVLGKTVKSGESYEFVAPKNGDIEFQIANYGERSEDFTFDLGIMSEHSDEMDHGVENVTGERVTFARGESSAMVTKDIPAQGSVDFVFTAKKGQTIGIELGYDFKDSDLKGFLSEPGLQDVSLTMGPKTRMTFVVKKTGDHRLTVNNLSRKMTTFTLYLDIE